jgi:CRISPR-associated protein Cmr1
MNCIKLTGDTMLEKMTEIELKISFNTPAFLGNAEQNAQWRTPPFKALLRRWWRVVKAKEVDYDYKKLLEKENKLFGKATDKDATRSKLMLRLDKWEKGQDFETVKMKVWHPEVGKQRGMNIDSQLYLGYGPISIKGNKKALPEGSSAILTLLLPEEDKKDIETAVDLIALFGTIGSRSRNGWGSIHIEGRTADAAAQKGLITGYSRDLADAMKLDWAHCIGCDSSGKLLIWKTRLMNSWGEVMQKLAEIKIGFRTKFRFTGGKYHKTPEKRHIISYPVTNHDLDRMRNARNPNQVIFKVLRSGEKYYGVVYHMPSKVSDDFFENSDLKDNYKRLENSAWEELHGFLNNGLNRI